MRQTLQNIRGECTWIVPTLILAKYPSEIEVSWEDDARARFLHLEERAYWSIWGAIYAALLGTPGDQESYSRWIRRVARSMHRAGVRFLAGTDAGYPGIYWGSTLHLADLVLLEANPLEDISNTETIEAVVVRGRYFGRDALDELIARAEKAARGN